MAVVLLNMVLANVYFAVSYFSGTLLNMVVATAFFTNSVTGLKTVVTAIGAGIGIWGVINLLEGYGNDNPGAKSQGIKQVIPK